MTIKKLTVIAAAGAVLLAGAIGLSMSLTSRQEMEIEVPETPTAQEAEDGSKTLGDMENMPLYYDETDKLLLPLRDVMEGLGGSVKWDAETKMVVVEYRGRVLEADNQKREARLNGYDVLLPDALKSINGCLYADAEVFSSYYTGEVAFDHETRQVTLQVKESTAPVVAKKLLLADAETGVYSVEVPVIIGLNDSNYEKSLNKSLEQEMQAYIDVYLASDEEQRAEGLFLKLKTGLYTKDFLSLWWEGTDRGKSVKFAKNIDLLGQKTVTLADMLQKESLEDVKAAAGEGWTEDRFFLTAEGGLVLLKGSNENSLNLYYWTTEGEQPVWKDAYQKLFQKK